MLGPVEFVLPAHSAGNGDIGIVAPKVWPEPVRSETGKEWDAFWSGGISNPMEVIEQITYLLFIKRLDELHTVQEAKANRLKKPIENSVFGPKQQALRWSRFKNEAPAAMYETVSTKVFPFIKELKSAREDSAYSHHMKDARFTIPKDGLLAKVVDLIDKFPTEDRSLQLLREEFSTQKRQEPQSPLSQPNPATTPSV